MIDLTPQLQQLDPDIIHVHDVYMMATAARYAQQAATRGRKVRLIYDAREYVRGLAHVPPTRVLAYTAMEHEYLPDFDRIVTVSQGLADLLVERYGLVRQPDLVLNAPIPDPLPEGQPTVRRAAGVDPDVPLMVYGGVVNPARGLQTVIKALPLLEGVHLALIVNNRGHAIRHLQTLATQLGVQDRLHLVDYVPHNQVTAYIADATLGLSPLSHTINHDVTITNKFCEYIAAGLPIVTSDTPAQAELVASLGLGAIYTAENTTELATAIKQVLNNHQQLTHRIQNDPQLRQQFTWPTQAKVLTHVYAEEMAALEDGAA
jgi:glycosyltransferase involved in cell wall biosynthesis